MEKSWLDQISMPLVMITNFSSGKVWQLTALVRKENSSSLLVSSLKKSCQLLGSFVEAATFIWIPFNFPSFSLVSVLRLFLFVMVLNNIQSLHRIEASGHIWNEDCFWILSKCGSCSCLQHMHNCCPIKNCTLKGAGNTLKLIIAHEFNNLRFFCQKV